jgi:ankyrin repeat protein
MAKNSIWEKYLQPALNAHSDLNHLRFFPEVNKTLSLLQMAILTGTLEDVQRLVTEYGADVNGIGDLDAARPLHAAVAKKNTEMVSFLLKQGARPDIKTEHGISPIWSAIAVNDADLVTLLLDHAELAPQDSLVLAGAAIAHKCMPCITQFWTRYRDTWASAENLDTGFAKSATLMGIFSRDAAMQTGLLPVYKDHVPHEDFPTAEEVMLLAARFGQKYVVSTLVNQGYDVNTTTPHGVTALMWAASRPSNSAMVKYLLEEAKMDPTALDDKGHNALDYAKYYFVAGDTLSLLSEAGLESHNDQWEAAPIDVTFTSLAAFEDNRMLKFDPATHALTYLALSPLCNYHGLEKGVVRDEAFGMTFIICEALPGSELDAMDAVLGNQRPGEGYYISTGATCNYHGFARTGVELDNGMLTDVCQHTRGHLPLEGKIVEGQRENLLMVAQAQAWLKTHPDFFLSTDIYECEGRGFTYGHVYGYSLNEEYDILDLVDVWICKDPSYGRSEL